MFVCVFVFLFLLSLFFQQSFGQIGIATSTQYIYVPVSLSKLDASDYCNEKFGTKLASIHNAGDVTEITGISNGNNVWIGLTVDTSAWKVISSFYNEDGSLFDYGTDVSGGVAPWFQGEPNQDGSIITVTDGEFCVEIYSTGLVNDKYCSAHLHFICNSPYSFVSDPSTQEEASQYCQDLGGELVSIADEEQNEAVKNLLVFNSVTTYSWIGLQRASESSAWYWEDGTSFSSGDYGYCATGATDCDGPWYNVEPNNNGGIEDCVHMYGEDGRDRTGNWNDIPCTLTQSFVCAYY